MTTFFPLYNLGSGKSLQSEWRLFGPKGCLPQTWQLRWCAAKFLPGRDTKVSKNYSKSMWPRYLDRLSLYMSLSWTRSNTIKYDCLGMPSYMPGRNCRCVFSHCIKFDDLGLLWRFSYTSAKAQSNFSLCTNEYIPSGFCYTRLLSMALPQLNGDIDVDFAVPLWFHCLIYSCLSLQIFVLDIFWWRSTSTGTLDLQYWGTSSPCTLSE